MNLILPYKFQHRDDFLPFLFSRPHRIQEILANGMPSMQPSVHRLLVVVCPLLVCWWNSSVFVLHIDQGCPEIQPAFYSWQLCRFSAAPHLNMHRWKATILPIFIVNTARFSVPLNNRVAFSSSLPGIDRVCRTLNARSHTQTMTCMELREEGKRINEETSEGETPLSPAVNAVYPVISPEPPGLPFRCFH